MDLSTREGRREQGKRIQQAAEKADLSLESLARAIGCSRALIYQYVSGTTLAQPDKVQRIASTTGTPLGWFYETPDVPAEEPPTTTDAAGRAPSPSPPPDPTEPSSPPLTVDEQRLRGSLTSLQELAEAQGSGPNMKAHLSTCERIIPLARELGDRDTEAGALLSIGNTHLQLGDHDAAEASLRRGLDLLQELDESDRALACRQTLGAALTAGGDIEGARDQFSEVAASDEWGNRWKGVLSLGALGEWTGEYREAMTRLDEAETIIAEGTDSSQVRTAMAYVAANRVNVFLGCGDYRNALALARDAFADAESTGNADQYVESQLNIGVCLTALGQWMEAADWLRRAQQVSRLMGDAQRETVAGGCLAESLAEAGRYAEAKTLARDAVTAAASTNAARCLILAHRALGTVCLRAGAVDDALYHLQQAAERSAEVGMAGSELWCRVRIAEAQLASGGAEAARTVAAKCADDGQRLGAEHAEGEARQVLAQCHLHCGDAASATDEATRALSIGEMRELPDLQTRAHDILAQCALAAGDADAANEHWRSAMSLLDQLRQQFADSDESDEVLEDSRRLVLLEHYARFLLDSDRGAEAEKLLDAAAWPPLADALRNTP